ncbi:MAG: aspartyl protease family protein [Hyphomicrobiales bacterium]
MGETVARWIVLVLFVGLCLAPSAGAEFYKYVDGSGKTYYVDEIWKIPEEYRGQVGRYLENHDNLPSDQKAQAMKAEQDRRRALEMEQQRQTEAQLQEMRQSQEAERLRQAEASQQQQLKAMETKVTIANNQILVPVSFTNSGQETTADLILDTGATHTVLYRPVADQLNILTLGKGQSKVAGGQSVHSEVGKVDSIRVGPITARDVPVVILFFEGNSPGYGGLLGMDFLSRVEYAIDYENSVIRWKLRSR